MLGFNQEMDWGVNPDFICRDLYEEFGKTAATLQKVIFKTESPIFPQGTTHLRFYFATPQMRGNLCAVAQNSRLLVTNYIQQANERLPQRLSIFVIFLEPLVAPIKVFSKD